MFKIGKSPAQLARLTSHSRIDRQQKISFTFDGKSYTGYAGDTLASALLANGSITMVLMRLSVSPARNNERSTTFLSSRMFPGQWWPFS